MSSAQVIGQWLGVTLIAVFLGYIGYRVLRLALWIRDAFERRRRSIVAAQVVAELVPRSANLTLGGVSVRELPPFELMTASPPCELAAPRATTKWPRAEYPRAVVVSSRREGKTEDLRRQLERLHADTLCTPYCLRPYLFGGSSLDSMAAGLILRQATKGPRPPGEIAVGVCLDLERDFLDGDRPTLTPPRGIFGGGVELC